MLDSPDKIRFFRERFDCIGREGNWSHYVSPRLLPWPDEMSKCDVGHLKKSTRHVAFQDADRMVGQFQEVVTQIAEISKMGRGAPLHLLNQLRQLKRRRDELIRQWTVRDTLKYFWLVPGSSMDGQDGAAASDGSSTNASSCAGPWEWFDPAKFCRILDKRSVLIVGDSINMLLADAIRFNVRLGAKDWDSRVQWDLGFSVRVFFVRDYYLNSTEAENDFMVDKSFGETWMDEIAAQGVSVVVMNRGAHFIADEQFERQMKSTLLALRKSYPDLLIIVRNTPAGHPHCWLHRKPLSGKLLDLPHDDWHWDGFAAQNEILKNLTEGVGGVYMDVNASAVWRADGHVGRWDCLHYCHPGPVDTWVQLLFNMLLGLLVPTS
ncbi:unnamed protein product [Closterium sp. NIES-64]|nr:unnamed protein product [Closterium sp. NIES-64]